MVKNVQPKNLTFYSNPSLFTGVAIAQFKKNPAIKPPKHAYLSISFNSDPGENVKSIKKTTANQIKHIRKHLRSYKA